MKERGNNKYLYMIDSLIVFLNISNSYSIIPYILFFQYKRGINTVLIILINLIYLLLRYRKNIKIPFKHPLFVIYFILNFINVCSAYFTDTKYIMPFVYLICNTLFYVVLYNSYIFYKNRFDGKETIWKLCRGYSWICIVCLISAIFLFILIKIGLSPHTNLVNDRMDLFEDNVISTGHTYYFPYFSSILLVPLTPLLRLPFFTEYGVICGIYFEPHILTFMLCPALFLLWAYVENIWRRIGLFLLWLLIILMASSTTNILSILCCFFVLLLYTKRGRILLVPIIYTLVLIIFIVGLENTELFFIADKLDGSSSMEYSQNTMFYAFEPISLFGYNFMSNSYLKEISTHPKDVGYIPCFLNILFLSIAYLKLIKCFFTKDRYKILISCAILYFFLHSMKIAMVSYSLSFLMLIIFLLQIVSSKKFEQSNDV